MALKKSGNKFILPECPVEITLQLLNDKRKILIIRELLGGTRRFGELRSGITLISQKVLTSHLRDLEACGLVRRKVHAQVPPRVDYSLTPTGRSLMPVLDAMAAWGEGYRAQYEAARQKPSASKGNSSGSSPTARKEDQQEEERQLVIRFD